jgi:hypothetical protein
VAVYGPGPPRHRLLARSPSSYQEGGRAVIHDDQAKKQFGDVVDDVRRDFWIDVNIAQREMTASGAEIIDVAFVQERGWPLAAKELGMNVKALQARLRRGADPLRRRLDGYAAALDQVPGWSPAAVDRGHRPDGGKSATGLARIAF